MQAMVLKTPGAAPAPRDGDLAGAAVQRQ